MDYLRHLVAIADKDVEVLRQKERTYRGSWKKRGGAGAFHMLARKWDRLENIANGSGGDIFQAIDDDWKLHGPGSPDGTALAEVQDLRRYLMLVEAEMIQRSGVDIDIDADGGGVSVDTTAFGYPDCFRNIKFAAAGPLVQHPDFPVDEREMAEDAAEQERYYRGRGARRAADRERSLAEEALGLLPKLRSALEDAHRKKEYDPAVQRGIMLLQEIIHSIERAYVPPSARGI
jgi:hypothetical protein